MALCSSIPPPLSSNIFPFLDGSALIPGVGIKTTSFPLSFLISQRQVSRRLSQDMSVSKSSPSDMSGSPCLMSDHVRHCQIHVHFPIVHVRRSQVPHRKCPFPQSTCQTMSGMPETPRPLVQSFPIVPHRQCPFPHCSCQTMSVSPVSSGRRWGYLGKLIWCCR